MAETVLALSGVTKTYNPGTAGELTVLHGIDLAIAPGEVVAMVAPSGAGKSTLLHIAGLLDQPSAGQVSIGAEDMTGASDRVRTGVRRDRIGFVYQFHHLLPEFSAMENVTLPQQAAAMPLAKARVRSEALLDAVGLKARASHRPGELSGGEQQRVAICRALANAPDLLLADEAHGQPRPGNGGNGVFRAGGSGAGDGLGGTGGHAQSHAGSAHGPDCPAGARADCGVRPGDGP